MSANRQAADPLVTVITVVYNAASALQRTILSVRAQSYPRIEHVVVDGGSTDGTLEVIKRYERHIARWVSEPDNGLYDAMNKGLAMATGTVVNFLNSDDVYAHEDVVARYAEMFRRDPAAKFIYAKTQYVNEDGGDYTLAGKNVVSGCMEHSRRKYICHQSAFYRKELHELAGNYDLRYRVCADYDFMMRVHHQFTVPFAFLDAVTIRFQRDGLSDSLQAVRDQKAIEDKVLGCSLAGELLFHKRRLHHGLKSSGPGRRLLAAYYALKHALRP